MKLSLIRYISAAAALVFSTNMQAAVPNPHGIAHVIMISVDGMHAFDLEQFIAKHPESALSGLAKSGIEYRQAMTVAPADSFPGLLALVTGGTPAVTGVYFDVTYDSRLSAPGSDCSTLGTVVSYDEAVDIPATESHGAAINPALLPRDPNGCVPVFPHSYLRTNTIFDVIHEAGGYTAWIDKHPVYEIVNGPSGRGVDDLWTPEIGGDFEGSTHKSDASITSSLKLTEAYDRSKVEGLINEIKGLQHDGKQPAPVPALMGLNLQAVNVGQKLSGYMSASGKPSDQIENALLNCDQLIGQVTTALEKQNLLDSTLIVVTAKHGNGPINPRTLRRIDKHKLINVIESDAPGTLMHVTSDRSALIWIKEEAMTRKVAHILENHATTLGIQRVLYGSRLRTYFHVSQPDSRIPDILVIPQSGVIYTKTGDSKRVEHGGVSTNDRHVALLLSNPQLQHAGTANKTPVATTQVAPTILAVLGLSADKLQAVVMEKTKELPGEDWAANAGHGLPSGK